MKSSQSMFGVWLLTILSVQGAEWATSGSKHCIERCKVGERNELANVFWCKVVDGVSIEHQLERKPQRPGAHETNESVDEEDKYPWDYCTPATLESIEDGEVFEEGVDAAILPEVEGFKSNRTKRQTGSSGFNPGTAVKRSASSLAGINCAGDCTENYGGKYSCEVEVEKHQNFFCSPEVPLKRRQLSSHNKLWCISDCVRGSSSSYYECRTLFGYDRCSPSGDSSSLGNKCLDKCMDDPEGETHHYQCKTEQGRMEDCGNWHISRAEKKTLEYTVEDQVCAGPCKEEGGEKTCSHVSWQWEEASQAAHLRMEVGYCGPRKNSWRLVGIVIGVIIGAILLIGIIAFFIGRRQYSRAATIDH